jgi:hypothetical protein
MAQKLPQVLVTNVDRIAAIYACQASMRDFAPDLFVEDVFVDSMRAAQHPDDAPQQRASDLKARPMHGPEATGRIVSSKPLINPRRILCS